MDSKKIDPNIWMVVILVAIGLIVGMSYLVISEVLEARKECNTLGGKYSLKITLGHLCNGRSFIKYNSCLLGGECNSIWTFEDSIRKETRGEG